jgi:multiple sugar transport system ATP-binding protein
MRTEISKLHKQLGATMIYVTHDQTEAMTMGDRIVIMKDGVVNQIDTPMNLYNNPVNRFVAGFIGSPAMNFIEGNLNNSNGLQFESRNKILILKLTENQIEKLKNYNYKKIWIGIRPEEFEDNNDFTHNSYSSSVDVKLDLVEPMGNESYLYFNIDDTACISRISAKDIPVSGSIRKLIINIEKLHFFDFENEQTII